MTIDEKKRRRYIGRIEEKIASLSNREREHARLMEGDIASQREYHRHRAERLRRIIGDWKTIREIVQEA